jgi:hypothetical protein
VKIDFIVWVFDNQIITMILLVLLSTCPLVIHGFSPLHNLMVSRGIISGIRQGIYNEISVQSNIISTAVQARDYHSTHPWILNASVSIVLWWLLINTSNDTANSRIRRWKRFSLSERLAKIFVLVFLEVITKNIEYAF